MSDRFCTMCGCSLVECNEGIDHIKYKNWNGEFEIICDTCLETLKDILL